MKIDIDIRISSDDGEDKLFEKHFSGKLNQKNASLEDLERPNRHFYDFMYEFLSARGKRLREELIGSTEKKVSYKPSMQDLIKDLEYTITLGTGRLLTGKIPLDGWNGCRNETKTEARERTEADNLCFQPAANYNRFRSFEKVEEFIQYFMGQAINSYESSFYHDSQGSAYFIEKS